MHHVDNDHEKSYVITYKELVFMFIVFSVILIVLYPKDILKEQIASEKSNYDLSMLYLKNLLEHDPENESLMLILAEQSLRSNKKDLSLRLLELLLESENKEYRNRATLLSYELKKDDYYYIKEEEKKRTHKESLRKLFRSIFKDKMYSQESIEKWYNESIFLQEDAAMYFFIKKKLLKEPYDIKLLESAYYLSLKLRQSKDSLKYVLLLVKYDTERKDKWILDSYYIFIKNRLFSRAEELLKANADESLKWKKMLAEFYLMRKEYLKSSDIYLEMLDVAKGYKLRKKHFFSAMHALQAGNMVQETALLAKKYELYYIGDPEVRKFLLKVYLATGNLDAAAALSRKILKREMKK